AAAQARFGEGAARRCARHAGAFNGREGGEVVWIERSEFRDRTAKLAPDFSTLNPGYTLRVILFQFRGDVAVEIVPYCGTQRHDLGSDRDRDARGDQRIFDRGSAA